MPDSHNKLPPCLCVQECPWIYFEAHDAREIWVELVPFCEIQRFDIDNIPIAMLENNNILMAFWPEKSKLFGSILRLTALDCIYTFAPDLDQGRRDLGVFPRKSSNLKKLWRPRRVAGWRSCCPESRWRRGFKNAGQRILAGTNFCFFLRRGYEQSTS